MTLFQIFDTTTRKWKLAASTVILEQETPTGTIDGVNQTFTIAFAPATAKSLQVFLDGLIVKQTNYTVDLANKQFTFVVAPSPGQDLYAVYAR